MRKPEELCYIRNKTIYEMRRVDCQGCIIDHGSQKYHFTCLTNYRSEYYNRKALTYMLENEKIAMDEFNFLNTIDCYRSQVFEDQENFLFTKTIEEEMNS